VLRGPRTLHLPLSPSPRLTVTTPPRRLRWYHAECTGWLCGARGGLKTACVGVGVALGWPLANQLPGTAGHPRPTWSTSPNIHIDLVVLADRRTPPALSPLAPPSSPFRSLLASRLSPRLASPTVLVSPTPEKARV
jgi:hypothetical protein